MPGDEFESVKHLVNWSQQELATFSDLTNTYFENQKITCFNHFEPNQQWGYCCLKLSDPPPIALRGHASNIIKNLRDALDQATAAATKIITGKKSTKAHFPFGESPEDLEKSLSLRKIKHCSGIPESLFPLFRDYEPYPVSDAYDGGNHFLRLLGRVSGNHKHDVTIGVGTTAQNYTLVGPTTFGGTGATRFGMKPEWDGANNQIRLFEVERGADFKAKVEYSLYISFDSSDLKGMPVEHFIKKVGPIVGEIAARLEIMAFDIGPPA